MKNNDLNAQSGHGKRFNIRPVLLKLTLAGGIALASGCASMVNIGETEYACPSTGGVNCKSTLEVYEMTHNGNVPERVEPEKKGVFSKGKKAQRNNSSSKATEEIKEVAQNEKSSDTVIDNYVAPRLPDRPVPIRTPASVMRIWIAPWQDKNGDLNTTGYMYTEIEERRWVIGKGEAKADPVLRPLQKVQAVQN